MCEEQEKNVGYYFDINEVTAHPHVYSNFFLGVRDDEFKT